MSVRTEIKGNKYNKRTALGEFYLKPLPCGRKRCYELCQCECGAIQYVRRESLFNGHSRSCKKCMFASKEYRDKLSRANSKPKTHGMEGTPFYKKFRDILSRCNNENTKAYKYYGARGIKCLWKTFEEFRDDMYESYIKHCEKFGERQTTIDRIDNNGDYCKENCKRSTYLEQNRNKRNIVNFIS